MSVGQNNFHDMEVSHKMGIGGDMLELGAVNQSAHQAVTDQLSQLTPDEVWFVSPKFACVTTWLCLKTIIWRELFQCFLCQLKASLLWHIMRRKQRALLDVSYVLMSRWAYLCQNPKDKRLTRSLVNLSTRQLVLLSTRLLVLSLTSQLVNLSSCQLVLSSAIVIFLVRILTL